MWLCFVSYIAGSQDNLCHSLTQFLGIYLALRWVSPIFAVAMSRRPSDLYQNPIVSVSCLMMLNFFQSLPFGQLTWQREFQWESDLQSVVCAGGLGITIRLLEGNPLVCCSPCLIGLRRGKSKIHLQKIRFVRMICQRSRPGWSNKPGFWQP